MRIEDIMTSAVRTIQAHESAESAWRQMKSRRMRHLVVVDGKRVIGVVSDRDLGARESASSVRSERRVSEVMTPAPVTVAKETTVREAANLLRGRTIGCLPVVEADRLVGIVTTTDLLDLIGQGTERPVDLGKRWTLKHRGPRRKPVPADSRKVRG